MRIAICQICGQPMAGSALVDLSETGVMTGIYLLHMIDRHWEIVERIKATTDNSAAREMLITALQKEIRNV